MNFHQPLASISDQWLLDVAAVVRRDTPLHSRSMVRSTLDRRCGVMRRGVRGPLPSWTSSCPGERGGGEIHTRRYTLQLPTSTVRYGETVRRWTTSRRIWSMPIIYTIPQNNYLEPLRPLDHLRRRSPVRHVGLNFHNLNVKSWPLGVPLVS